jgi:hypothetical protein
VHRMEPAGSRDKNFWAKRAESASLRPFYSAPVLAAKSTVEVCRTVGCMLVG